ncbi:TetR/AcrR family transcriptional regulator C-terminal domain-containing protein [Aquipuribacter nitratireducens]|uniref:TetR/AcrR family transcriptional regulator C-terminal domain-containing protein n=1 Tax=Aquipuribacter nitratireducens TaxID=650104 RepID=A0ABW0GMV1_9MICO
MAGTDEVRRGRTGLSRSRVLEAAVALADRDGVDGLTIRALATELSTKPMSIYHYVAGKDAILDGLVDQVFAEITHPPTDLPWQAALRVRCHSAREVLARHPWAVPLLESRVNPGEATLDHHEAVLACLRGGGLSLRLTAHAYAVLDSYVYGFALQEATLPAHGSADIADVAEQILAGMDAGRYPSLHELTRDHVLQPGYGFGASFEVGMDLLLDGLTALAEQEADLDGPAA